MFAKRSHSKPPRRQRPTSSAAPRSAGPVFSYSASRAPRNDGAGRNSGAEQTKRLKAPRRLFRRTSHVVIVILVAALVLANLLLSHQVKIVVLGDPATSSSVYLRSQKTYTDAARAILAGSLLNSNKLTISTKRMSDHMRRQFPELAAVSVTLPLVGRQPVVYIEPAVPKLILTTIKSGSFVVDENGRALLTGADQIAKLNSLHLPVVSDLSGLEVAVQDAIVPSGTVSFITEVASQLKAKKIEVQSMVLPAGAIELHLGVKGTAYIAKFNLQGSAREEVGSFLATKQYLEVQKKSPKEYVDVRVENRVYYR